MTSLLRGGIWSRWPAKILSKLDDSQIWLILHTYRNFWKVKKKKETSILSTFLHVVLIQHGLALRKVEEFEKAIMKYIQTYIPGKHNIQTRFPLGASSVNYFKIFTMDSHFIWLLAFYTLNFPLAIFQNKFPRSLHFQFQCSCI